MQVMMITMITEVKKIVKIVTMIRAEAVDDVSIPDIWRNLWIWEMSRHWGHSEFFELLKRLPSSLVSVCACVCMTGFCKKQKTCLTTKQTAAILVSL